MIFIVSKPRADRSRCSPYDWPENLGKTTLGYQDCQMERFHLRGPKNIVENPFGVWENLYIFILFTNSM